MGPGKNKELFDSIAQSQLDGISQESQRRDALGTALKRLSMFFEVVSTAHNLSEPALLTRLFALSLVQNSKMGISGFEPLLALTHDQPNGSIYAKKAPAHDKFIDENGIEYRTRVINVMMPRYEVDDTIELYGLNLYVPTDQEQDEELSSRTNGSKSRLVIVNAAGEIVQEPQPITGGTAVFAVRNKRIGDAKAYTVELEEEDDTLSMASFGSSSVRYISDTEAIVRLNDGRQVKINELKDELLMQAIDELRNGSKELAGIVKDMDGLNDDERRAAFASARGYYSSSDLD